MFPLKIPTLTQGIDVRRDWAQQNRDAVERFLKAYMESIQLFKTNETLAKSTVSKWTQLSDQAMLDESYQLARSELAAYPLVQDASVQNVLDLSTDAKVKSHPPSFYYDNSYLEPLKSFVQGLYPSGIPSV
jgi:ABC-type nitrate/sulfonate/bicarbonate transport system substrate-binding protein